MLSISVYETVGNQIALVALGPHLPDCLCRDQVPAGWRMDTQLAGASDFRDRRLLHRYRPQLRRPLAFGHTSLADQEGSVYGRAWRVCGTIMNRLGDRPTRRQATPLDWAIVRRWPTPTLCAVELKIAAAPSAVQRTEATRFRRSFSRTK